MSENRDQGIGLNGMVKIEIVAVSIPLPLFSVQAVSLTPTDDGSRVNPNPFTRYAAQEYRGGGVGGQRTPRNMRRDTVGRRHTPNLRFVYLRAGRFANPPTTAPTRMKYLC